MMSVSSNNAFLDFCKGFDDLQKALTVLIISEPHNHGIRQQNRK